MRRGRKIARALITSLVVLAVAAVAAFGVITLSQATGTAALTASTTEPTRPARPDAMALVASTTILFVAGTSPAFWLKPVCDALAVNLLAAVWVGGIGLAVFALRFENAGAGARCAAVSAIGASPSPQP